MVYESTSKSKGYVTLGTFRNFTYVWSYLQTKIFERRLYNIFKKTSTKMLIKAILESP